MEGRTGRGRTAEMRQIGQEKKCMERERRMMGRERV